MSELIKAGFSIGISVPELYQMEIWELNLCISVKKELVKEEYKRDIAIAYNTGAFSSSMHPLNKRKPKDLSYYLNNIDQKTKSKTKEEIEKGIEFAKKMAKERIRNGRSNT